MKTIFILLYILIFTCFAQEKVDIKNYQAVNKSVTIENKKYTILRSYEIESEKFYLVVDENSLKTKVYKKEFFNKAVKNKFSKSRYQSLLNKYSKNSKSFQNYGVKHIPSNKIFLTVDLCPSSKKGYEDMFFNKLNSFYKHKKDIPITIFISGKWIKTHEKEFLELLLLQKEGKLDITWSNHTFSHPYNKKFPIEKNFLLIENVSIKEEILNLEKLLLSYKIKPSILFRFPGLISDNKTITLVNSLGLIPIGSDSWLAKDEKIKSGSIILIHGNKNEPIGIKKAIEFFKKNKGLILGSLLDEV